MGDGRYQTQPLWLRRLHLAYCTNENNRNDLTFNHSFIHSCADDSIERHWIKASRLKNNRKLSKPNGQEESQWVMRGSSSYRAFDGGNSVALDWLS